MRPRQVSDSDILDMARKVFLQQGYGVAVSVIAQELGLSQPALFKRFQTKKELFIQAMIPQHDAPWHVVFQNSPDHRSFEEQFSEVVFKMARYFVEIGPYIEVVKMSPVRFNEVFPSDRETPPEKTLRLCAEWLDRCAAQGLIKEVDTEMVATSLLGTLHLTSFISVTRAIKQVQHEEDLQRLIRFYLSILEK